MISLTPDTLLVDRIKPVVVRDLVSCAIRWRENFVEQADEIDWRELPDRNVDRFQRRNDPVAHRDEVIIGETGPLPDAHRHHDTEIAHEKWSIARER